MTTSQAGAPEGPPRTPYKRKWRNYLLDVGLQIRYTSFIILIAAFLTGALGYKIYEATRDTSKIIGMTGLVDPASAQVLQEQFRDNDRVVLLGIIGFGVVLVFSIAGAGIWITHKVAGPIYNMASVCRRIRDDELNQSIRQLRKGDELQDFHSSFREMYEALRNRATEDIKLLNDVQVIFDRIEPKSPAMQQVAADLRDMRQRKEKAWNRRPGERSRPSSAAASARR